MLSMARTNKISLLQLMQTLACMGSISNYAYKLPVVVWYEGVANR